MVDQLQDEKVNVSNKKSDGANVPSETPFRAGDTVRVHYRVVEGDKSRVQPYEGIVISKRGEQESKTFMVRRIGADNVAIERIFPLFSPNIQKIEVLKRGDVRKAKLYYIRKKLGKAGKRVKELEVK